MKTSSLAAQQQKPRLLIVDDDSLIVDSLAFVLGDAFEISTASSRQHALKLLPTGPSPDLALIDLGLPPNPHGPTEGLALITDLLSAAPDVRIVVLSGQNDDANARLARTLGATDFVGKPAAPDQLKRLLSRIADLRSPGNVGKFLGTSLPIAQLRVQLAQLARSPFPVLIEGESGTGKELAARTLHDESDRAARPYLALNCAAIAPTLVEATLFGHGKGAFTGAHSSHAGYFEDASDGTLFLDEIGELPLELQPKLLRVLENGEYQRVGETQSRRSSARIVAATNRDLREEIRAGRFRADLYHRLSVFTVQMPPLRSLDGDVRVLLNVFLRDFAQQGKVATPTLDDSAWDRVLHYPFPGNVRELRNIAIRLTTKHAGKTLTAADLDSELDQEIVDTGQPALPGNAPGGSVIDSRDNLVTAAKTTLATRNRFSLDEELRSLEAAYIEAAQQIANGNISQAARLLGLSRTTLYNRIESLARNQRRHDSASDQG